MAARPRSTRARNAMPTAARKAPSASARTPRLESGSGAQHFAPSLLDVSRRGVTFRRILPRQRSEAHQRHECPREAPSMSRSPRGGRSVQARSTGAGSGRARHLAQQFLLLAAVGKEARQAHEHENGANRHTSAQADQYRRDETLQDVVICRSVVA